MKNQLTKESKESKESRFNTDTDIVIPCTLVDTGIQTKTKSSTRKAIVRITPMGISVAVEGYGDAGSTDGYGEPIWIEFYNKKLTVRCWADITQEDPTDCIDMEGAREDLRPYSEIKEKL